MENLSAKLHTASVQTLTRHELHEFDLVVSNARSMGWLSPDQQLGAVRWGSSIIVRVIATDPPHERAYEDGHRWLYQFLHELTQGLWKAKRSGSPVDAIPQRGQH
jgi:hypothetical protein